jgi:hypothetical protein
MSELKDLGEDSSWEDSAPEGGQEIPRRQCNRTISLPCLQESAKGVFLGSNESLPQNIRFPWNVFQFTSENTNISYSH